MTKPLTRRQKNQQLAEMDRYNRCSLCRRNLHESGQVFHGGLERFCSLDCLKDWGLRMATSNGGDAKPLSRFGQ